MTQLILKVNADENDAWQQKDGPLYYLENQDLHVWSYSTPKGTGVRFTNVQIPKGAVIVSAKLKMYALYGNLKCDVYIHDVSESLSFDEADEREIWNRTLSSQSVYWSKDSVSGWIESPDLKNLIQAYVDRDDWEPGKAITVLLLGRSSDNKLAKFHAYYQHEEEAPELHITYTLPGFLSGWSYRKKHKIEPASGAGTDYQIKIKVHYGSGSDSGEDVYLNNHCRTDFGDVRFTKRDGTTLIDYWMEEKQDSDYAIFWLKIPEDLSLAKSVIYIYYGKSNATTISNGDETFLLFDHFDDGTIDTSKWTIGGYKYDITESGSNIILKVTESGTDVRAWVGSKNVFPVPISVEFFAKRINPNAGFSWLGMVTPPISLNYRVFLQQTIGLRVSSDSSYFRYSSANGSEGEVVNWTAEKDEAYHRIAVMRTGTSDKFMLDDETATGNYPTDIDRVVEMAIWYTNFPELHVDWCFVRKYTDPEPQHGSWGIEEMYLECQESISQEESLIKELRKISKDSIQFQDLNPKKSPKSFLETLSFSDSSLWHWLFLGSEFLMLLESKSFHFDKILQKIFHLVDKEISKRHLSEIFSISPIIKNVYKLKELSEDLLLQILLMKTFETKFLEGVKLQGVFEKLQRIWEQISISYSFSRYKIPIFFSTGFETGDLSRWDYTIERSGKIPEVVTDFVHHGTYSLKIGRGWGCVHKVIDLNPIWVKCFYRYTGNEDQAAIGPCISVNQSKEFNMKHPVYLAVGGVGFDESLRIYAHVLNGILTTKVMVGEFTKDTWHSIVLGAYRHSSQGWYKVYVDGKLVYSKENTWETNWMDCFAVSNQYLSPGAADPPPPELSVFQSLLFYSKIALSPRPLILTSLKLLSKILPFYFKKVLKEEEKELIFEVNA